MRRAALTLLVPLVLLALPARAELVILTDGEFIKVLSFEVVDEDRLRVTLPRNGSVTLALSRVERVIADEVPWPPEPEPEPPVQSNPDPRPLPLFSWRFDPAHDIPAVPYGELIYRAAKKHQLNPSLVAALVRTESAFRATAMSPKGARGLMQLMPATGSRFGLRTRDLYEPAKNLEAGAKYLAWLLERFKSDLELALAAYNAGEHAVDRYRGVPPYRETRNYIQRIYGLLGLDASGHVLPLAPSAEETAAVSGP